MYCNAIIAGSSHGHRQHAQKIWISLAIRFLSYASGKTNKQTNSSHYFATLPHTTISRLSGLCPRQPGEPIPEETFTYSHQPWSTVIPFLLPPSITIHGILPVQFMCLTIFFHNLSQSFLWSTSWTGTFHFILRTFLLPIIVIFLQYMPIPSQPVLL